MNKIYIKNICNKLSLQFPFLYDVYFLYEQFSLSKTHQYSTDIITATVIFLITKINDIQHIYIRDIVNVVLFENNRIKIINESSNTKKVELLLKDDYSNNETLISTMPDISLSNYLILKNEILNAEQCLLRIINFNFDFYSSFQYIFSYLIKTTEDIINNTLNQNEHEQIIKKEIKVLCDICENNSNSMIDIIEHKYFYIFALIENILTSIKENNSLNINDKEWNDVIISNINKHKKEIHLFNDDNNDKNNLYKKYIDVVHSFIFNLLSIDEDNITFRFILESVTLINEHTFLVVNKIGFSSSLTFIILSLRNFISFSMISLI